MNLRDKIKKVRQSIIAVGFAPMEQQVTIVGSGFAVNNDGKILSSAHLYNQLSSEQAQNLKGMVMIKRESNGLEQYKWLPLRLLTKDDKNDIALLQLDLSEETLLAKLDLGDSDKVEVGQEVYFVGFPYAAQLINEGYGITLIVNKTLISSIKQDGLDPAHPRNWFIVDAISNPGNSGCPLIDSESNKVIGVMATSFRIPSKVMKDLDIREPMHIAGARPINLAQELLK